MVTQAFIRTMGRRKAERFIRELALIASHEESVRSLMPHRPAANRARRNRAQNEAAEWLRQVLPFLISSLPPE